MRLISAAVAACVVSGCAAPGPQQPPIELVRVHEVAGKSKADLCRAARDWAAMTFRDSKAVIEVFDAEAGTMIGKGYVGAPYSVPGLFVTQNEVRARFTMNVECRDARLRATYRDVVGVSQYGDFQPQDNPVVKTRTLVEQKLGELDDSLKAFLAKKATGDW